MADDAAGAATTTDASPATGDAAKTFTQEELDRIVGERLGRERQKYEGFDDLKAKAEKFDEIQRSQQSDLERITGERDTFKSTAEQTQAENLRLRVAVDKGLVGDRAFLADRLRGATLEELSADADSLLEQFKPPATSFDAGARDTAPAGDDMNARLRAARGR
jgi:hypothetical protein